jgi:uncharacterized protein
MPNSPIVHSVLWRRCDLPGHDSAALVQTAGGWELRGTSVFLDETATCRLDYRVRCDAGWRTTDAIVRGWRGQDPINADIAVDANGAWRFNGNPAPQVEGCVDIDLSFTPATNLIPMRRLAIADVDTDASAAWFTFPTPGLERLDQIYRRIDTARYAYRAPRLNFSAVLTTHASGFVTRYGDLWVPEDASAH